jgi:hypothetical protein
MFEGARMLAACKGKGLLQDEVKTKAPPGLKSDQNGALVFLCGAAL